MKPEKDEYVWENESSNTEDKASTDPVLLPKEDTSQNMYERGNATFAAFSPNLIKNSLRS